MTSTNRLMCLIRSIALPLVVMLPLMVLGIPKAALLFQETQEEAWVLAEGVSTHTIPPHDEIELELTELKLDADRLSRIALYPRTEAAAPNSQEAFPAKIRIRGRSSRLFPKKQWRLELKTEPWVTNARFSCAGCLLCWLHPNASQVESPHHTESQCYEACELAHCEL